MDVTDQLESQRQLQELQREISHLSRANAMGELTLALAHELNQPLGAILSNAQAARRLLKSSQPDLTEIREIMEDIIQDDKRAGEVINRMRAMLRRQPIESERFDLGEALREVTNLLHGEFLARGVDLRLELEPDLPPVLTGRIEIQQVAMNFMMNALQAMRDTPPERRELVVKTCRQSESIEATIRDTGRGVPPDLLPRIFEPFVTTKPDGMGIGLAICKRIVERDGGRIWGRNNNDGIGATFGLVQRFATPE